MAKPDKKKSVSSKSMNAARRNGKAFKKNPKTNTKKRTPAAELRHCEILKRRQERREAGMERHRQELEERAAVAAEAKARIAAEIEEEARNRRAGRAINEIFRASVTELFSHAS